MGGPAGPCAAPSTPGAGVPRCSRSPSSSSQWTRGLRPAGRWWPPKEERQNRWHSGGDAVQAGSSEEGERPRCRPTACACAESRRSARRDAPAQRAGRGGTARACAQGRLGCGAGEPGRCRASSSVGPGGDRPGPSDGSGPTGSREDAAGPVARGTKTALGPGRREGRRGSDCAVAGSEAPRRGGYLGRRSRLTLRREVLLSLSAGMFCAAFVTPPVVSLGPGSSQGHS